MKTKIEIEVETKPKKSVIQTGTEADITEEIKK